MLRNPLKGRGQEFYSDADEIIKETKCFRDEGFFGLNWPKKYLVIGDDGAGSVYFIDLNQTNSPVYFADHEHAAVDERWHRRYVQPHAEFR